MDVPLSHRDLPLLQAAWPAQPLTDSVRLRRSEADDPDALLIEGEYVLLVLPRSKETDACPALQTNGQCGIYAHRPRACRTFPFDKGRLGLLKIDSEAQEIYASHCDKVPLAPETRRDGQRQLRRGRQEFGFYRELVSCWNDKVRSQSAAYSSLQQCLEFLLIARELELQDPAAQQLAQEA